MIRNIVWRERLEAAGKEVPSYIKDGLKLENYKSRMVWIISAAKKFDELYKYYPEFIKEEVGKIAEGYKFNDRNLIAIMTQHFLKRRKYENIIQLVLLHCSRSFSTIFSTSRLSRVQKTDK